MGDPPPDLGMPIPWVWLLRVALVAATVLAVALARRRPDYKPVAAILVWSAFAHLGRLLLLILVLAPERAAGRVPYQGLPRVAFHFEQALFTSWPFAIAALAMWIFHRRSPWPIALAYSVLLVVLAFGYPTIRRELLAGVYLGVTLAALAVAIGCFVTWRWRSRREWSPEASAASAILVFEAGAIVGPYSTGLIDVTWPMAQGLYMVLYALLAVLEGSWLRKLK